MIPDPFLTVFAEIVQKHTTSQTVSQQLWAEIETRYTHKSRHYHNLQHLQNMYEQLLPVKEAIDDWETLLFALFYHDAVYSTTAKDNEAKSAAFAEKVLKSMAYPEAKIQRCVNHILATQKHNFSFDSDTNYLTDADLSILGAAWPEYEKYIRAIRKEYAIYPDLLYKPGRCKVLQHFLAMEKIYKTVCFQDRYETSAKANLTKELLMLS